MRSRPHEAFGCGLSSTFGSGTMTIGSASGVPTAMAPSWTMNATRESPLIAIASASVECRQKPLSAELHVLEKLPPYVVVRSVAVPTTTGSGMGAATKDVELESTANVELDAGEIAKAVEGLALLGVVGTGVGTGSAMGVRSVDASTTI